MQEHVAARRRGRPCCWPSESREVDRPGPRSGRGQGAEAAAAERLPAAGDSIRIGAEVGRRRDHVARRIDVEPVTQGMNDVVCLREGERTERGRRCRERVERVGGRRRIDSDAALHARRPALLLENVCEFVSDQAAAAL